jgi:hypothetical protein
MSDPGFATGVGATNELSLRVSVATLARVLFKHPNDGKTMLALERRTTTYQTEAGIVVQVKSQPFGGAIHIHDLRKLQQSVGDFHFDSDEARFEQDFRIFIRPSAWEAVRGFCLVHIHQPDDPVLEFDPRRELLEEFADTMEVNLQSDQYSYQAIGTVVENDPSPTENIAARGYPTARIYRIFEARVLDPWLAETIIRTGEGCAEQGLRKRALEDFQKGRPGRGNTILALPLDQIRSAYFAVAPEVRNVPILFQNHTLDETVAAVLDDVSVPKYQRYP